MDDPSYKRLLKHARIVKDLLIGFIAPQRAPGWAGALDFDTLQEGPTEEITDELRRRLGDVVWSIDRWLGALGRKWGVKLPSICEYEEVSAVLAEKIDRWGAEILEQGIQQGIEQGIERQKALLHGLAERRFGRAAAERLSAALAGVTDANRLAEAGEWIVDCVTTVDFLARVDRTNS